MTRLPRQAKLFGAVSLLNDLASEMIYPLLPAFVVGTLGAGAAALGALDGAAEFASAFVKLGAGRLADRPGRRGPLIVVGYAVAVVIRPVIAFTAAAWQVIVLRVVDRIGKGIRTPPRDALIADVTPLELRGRAFGLQRGLDHAGAVLGPLAAWLLLTTHTLTVRGVISASIVPGIAVLVLATWAVRDGGRRSPAAAAPVPPPVAPAAPRHSPPAALFAISLFYLLRVPETLILLRAQQLGVSVAAVTLLWAAVHVTKSLTSFWGGELADRIGPVRTMWLGWTSYALLAAGFAFAAGPGAAWALFVVMGIVAGLTESPERALVARLAGGRQGAGFGAYHAVTGLAALLGGLALGGAIQYWGPETGFTASAVGVALLSLLWPFFSRAFRVPTP